MFTIKLVDYMIGMIDLESETYNKSFEEVVPLLRVLLLLLYSYSDNAIFN